MTTTTERSRFLWAKVESVIPNPLNPRRTDNVKLEDIAERIATYGWEIPLTAYQRGNTYVLMSGHRRFAAAKTVLKVKEVPIHIVDAPANFREEQERIASMQRGQEDWTPFEWANYVYEAWVAWNREPLKQFAVRIKINERTVQDYIQVMDYFPRPEIEAKLSNGTYHITVLSKLCFWLRKLKNKYPRLVEELTNDMVRRSMLAKIERGLIVKEHLHADKFLANASENEVRLFLTNNSMSLREAAALIGISDEDATKTLYGHLTSLGKMNNRIYDMKPKNKQDCEALTNALLKVQQTIKIRLEGLEGEYQQFI